METSEDAWKNRAHWDRISDWYQARHGPQLNANEYAWGVWALPEDELRVLGDVAGKDVLELGCGGAQWSIFLARRGARPVSLDNSARQLDHARRLMAEMGVSFPLIHASAEDVPLDAGSFDIVFCDHGAMSFADPVRTVPEAARLLRPGGLLVFNMSSPLWSICVSPTSDRVEDALQTDYFGMHRFEYEDQQVEYQLPYGEWIRLFRRNGFVVEDLVELRPPEGATTTYEDYAARGWARRWPAENIWKARKLG
ncbi:MAG: methyltransferase domain-containing protein [Chloroflexi bacterium]|nr:methyltransferase domain-containing protein [Chloroflexota bacterium]